jgi:delta8-fatty-acid desaturase
MASRDQVAASILKGDLLIVYHSELLKIPASWLDAHPGGRLALLHFVGRDATDEIEAYHPPNTLPLISRFSVGRVQLTDGVWQPLLPPIMSGWVRKSAPDRWFNEAQTHRYSPDTPSEILLVKQDSHPLAAPDLATLEPPSTNLSPKQQAEHSRAYKELHSRIANAGLYETPYLTGYGPEILRYTLLGFLSAYAYFHNWLITSAVFLGLMWHQLVFSAHDLGHMGVTHNWTIDRLLGILIADFIGGLSIGWWVEVRLVPFVLIVIRLPLIRTTMSIIVRTLPSLLLIHSHLSFFSGHQPSFPV